MKYYISKTQYENIDLNGIVDTSNFNTTKTDYHDIEIETQSCFSCDRDFILESHNNLDAGYFCDECQEHE